MRIGLSAPFVAAVLVIVAGAAASPGAGSNAATGSLELNSSLALASALGGCQPAAGSGDECAARKLAGLVPGLGRVSAEYSFLLHLGSPVCPVDFGKALAYPIRLLVADKGEIDVAVAGAAECVSTEAVRTQTQAFTVVGGTGRYAGASGSGTLESTLGAGGDSGRHGQQTWKGILNVAGLDFDLTPPTLSGATNKTVAARKGKKTVRVAYQVSATDDQDGKLPVTCTPRSGSRFRLGRTRVRCQAIDGSANTAAAAFTVLIKPRR